MVPPDDNADWRLWRRKIDERLEVGDRRFARNEEIAAERYKTAGERHRELLAAIEGLRAKRARELPPYVEDGDDEISGIDDLNELKQRARKQRASAKSAMRWKKWGRAAAPVVAGASIALWEMVKHWIIK
jgi:hypothetical protein